jgi:hypothetical protein
MDAFGQTAQPLLAGAMFALTASLWVREPRLGRLWHCGDPSGSSVPSANVRVLNTGTGVAREVITDERGNFATVSLIPGLYSVEVKAPNFQAQTQENLRLDVSGTINLTFRLTVGQVTETVSVQAEAELLKSTEGVIATVIDNTKVVELPLNGAISTISSASLRAQRGARAERRNPERADLGCNWWAKRQLELHARRHLQQWRVLQDSGDRPSIDAISDSKFRLTCPHVWRRGRGQYQRLDSVRHQRISRGLV